MIQSIARPAAVAIIILLFTLPFISQPVHIDDWVFIAGAEQFCRHPLNPLDGTIGFFGRDLPFSLVTHPPFLFLYISLINVLTGRTSILLLHICYLPFSLLGGISVFLLAKRFSRMYLYITLLFLVTPVFMVMSHSLMSDLPMLSLFLAALAAYIYGIDKNKSGLLTLSSVLSALTVLCSYQGLFLFFLFYIYTVLNRHRKKTFILVSILPFCLLIAWLLYVREATGMFHISAALYWTGHNYLLSPTRIVDCFTGSLCSLGGVTIFPLSLFFLPWKFRKRVGLYLISIIATLYFLFSRAGNYIPENKLAFFIFFLAGFLITSRIIVNTFTILKMKRSLLHRLRKKKDEAFLGIWYLGFLVLMILLLPHGIPRYLLPLTFPLITIGLLGFEHNFGRRGVGVFLMMTLLFTLGTGIMVSWADYGNARINARAAEDISQRFRGEDVEITFTGELGFRYYLETKGYEYLLSDIGHLKPGEILVEPGNYLQGGISPELMQHLDLIERMEYPVSPIITLLSRANRTDFYGQYYGFLPYFPAGGERHFNLYRYETPARYKKLTGTSSGGIPDIMPRHTFSNYLSLLDWNINRATPEQGDRLEITLRWRVEDGFNPDFRAYLRLNNRYSPLVLIHDIRKDEPGLRDWRKGDIVEELYTIAHISKNTYPGKYEVSTGLIPKKDSSTRSSQLTGIKYEDYVIGTVDIEPRIYRNDLIPDREERYFPQLRQFSGRLLSFSLTRDKEVNIPVDLPGPVSSIRIISFLAYGFALRDGEKIARITVVDNDGDDHTFYFKVGRDTADWAIDHPGYDRSIYKHHIAEVYNRWRVTHRGTSGWGYKYITYLRFEKPIIPVKVIMKYVNNVGVLIVEDLSAEESVI